MEISLAYDSDENINVRRRWSSITINDPTEEIETAVKNVFITANSIKNVITTKKVNPLLSEIELALDIYSEREEHLWEVQEKLKNSIFWKYSYGEIFSRIGDTIYFGKEGDSRFGSKSLKIWVFGRISE